MSELHDLKIEGLGSCYGGEFDNVKLAGMTSIKDSLKCKAFMSEGVCKSEGKIEAEDMTIDGTFKSNGDIKCKKLTIDGVISVKNSSINADELVADGFLSCNEISADVMKIDGVCNADKIYGDSITIVPRDMLKTGINIFFKNSNKSVVQLIECTKLNADYLSAGTIRASRVKLGKNCEADVVEYSEEADIAPEARVKQLVRI